MSNEEKVRREKIYEKMNKLFDKVHKQIGMELLIEKGLNEKDKEMYYKLLMGVCE